MPPATNDFHEMLTQTLEQTIDAVVVIDEKNLVTLFNAAAEAMWMRQREDVLGRNVGMLVPHAFRPMHDGYIEANRSTGVNRIVGTSREVTIERPDGSTLWASMSISKIQMGGRTHYAAFLKDVTHQKQEREQLRRLTQVVNESDNAILMADADGRVIYANAGVTRMLGYEPGEMEGRAPCEFLAGPYTDTQTVSQIRHLVQHPEAARSLRKDVLIYTKTGQPLWATAVINPRFDGQGRLLTLLAVLTDITPTKMYEVLQYKVLDAMVHEMEARDIATLLCREIERIAPEITVAVHAMDDEDHLHLLAAPSLPDTAIRAIDGQPAGPLAGSCGAAAWRGEPVLATDIATDPYWIRCGAPFVATGLVACWSHPVKARDGRVLGTFAFYYREQRVPSTFHIRLADVSVHLCALLLESERQRARIHQLAYYDALTGLPNRRLLLARTGRMLHEAQRMQTPLALAFVDIDRFKQINDTQGHAAGDTLLRTLARRFEEVARKTDLVARLGGDEFVLVLPQCDATQAAAGVERLLAALAQPVHAQGTTLHPCASVGIAMFPADGLDADTLLRHADMAMYEAKTSGGHRLRFFSAEMNLAAQEQAALETDLRAAIVHGGLSLHYQPQVEGLAPHALIGVEALLRWRHPVYGDIPPMRFVALAEARGFIDELSRWVLREACRQLADWRRRGIAIPCIAVNLSASNLRDPGLPALLQCMLAEYGLQPHDLQMEVTETAMLDPRPSVLANAESIRTLCIPLSLDDFGTGHSSLGTLHRLPIDELKLDRSFVQDLERNNTARALTASVLRLGESLGLRVVAEGVETEAQQRFLAERGCPVLQGYLFARPLHPDALEQWLLERHGPPMQRQAIPAPHPSITT